MRFGPKAALGAAALTGMLAFGTSAHAYLTSMTVNKCLAGKIKTSGKGVAAYTGCHSKGAGKLVPTDPLCLGKVSTKNQSAYNKLDTKPPCLTTGDAVARDTDAANYSAGVDAAVGHNGKCDAAKIKITGKYVAAVTGCYSKAAGKAPGVISNGPGSCTDKALVKFQNAINKAELKPPCTNSGLAALAALQSAANNFIDGQACLLDPTNPGCNPACGNGAIDAGEDCDTVGAGNTCAAVSNTGAAFTCQAGTCQCACPSTVTFEGNPNDPASILDTGWTGFGHRAPIISDGAVTVNVSCTNTSRPCGVCNISGPAENPNAGAGQLDTRRCTHDTSVRCNVDGDCGGGGSTCQHFFGSLLPLAAGGVTTCVSNQFNGSVTGTANIETGEAATTALLTSKVYLGIVIDSPCARCVGDATINDGVQGGTCSGGARDTQPCDGNGTVANRPDFGTTSLDCPSVGGALVATLPIDLTNATDPVTKTLTASSPDCGADPSEKCLCDTCNNAAASTCDANSDCPDPAGPIGAICGGRRCVGGTNNGAACNGVRQCSGGSNDFASCTVASQCPGGSCNVFCGVVCSGGPNTGNACTLDSECPGGDCPTLLCGRRGEPSKPSACTDDPFTANLDCTDDGSGEGNCDLGPLTSNCSVASGHAQRGCGADIDCGTCVGGANNGAACNNNSICPGGVCSAPGGSCQSDNRRCFLTGGLTGATKLGTNTLVAVGMEDAPMNDTSNPTLGAVFCTGVTTSDAVNTAAGLPGPGRVTIKGTAVGAP